MVCCAGWGTQEFHQGARGQINVVSLHVCKKLDSCLIFFYNCSMVDNKPSSIAKNDAKIDRIVAAIRSEASKASSLRCAGSLSLEINFSPEGVIGVSKFIYDFKAVV